MIKEVERIKNAVNVRRKDWYLEGYAGGTLDLVILDVGEVFTTMLYNLMFRVEGNLYGGDVVNIYMLDKKDRVTNRDVVVGEFLQEDIGKNKVDVIINRYRNIFTVKMYKVSREMYKKMETNLLDRGNIILIGEHEGQISTMFNRLNIARVNKGVYGGLASIFGYVTGDSVGVSVQVTRVYGDVVGNLDKQKDGDRGKVATDEYIKNIQLSNRLLNKFNQLVTKGLNGIRNFNVLYNVLTGEQINKIYSMESTVFHELYVYGDVKKFGVSDEEITEFSKVYKKYVEEGSIQVYLEAEKYGGVSSIAYVLREYKNMRQGILEVKIRENKGVTKEEYMVYKLLKNLTAGASQGVISNYALVKLMEKYNISIV